MGRPYQGAVAATLNTPRDLTVAISGTGSMIVENGGAVANGDGHVAELLNSQVPSSSRIQVLYGRTPECLEWVKAATAL
jgi:hypothetical protein